jgi:hypothetical protein
MDVQICKSKWGSGRRKLTVGISLSTYCSLMPTRHSFAVLDQSDKMFIDAYKGNSGQYTSGI